MSTVAMPATITGAQWTTQAALVDSWGGAEQLGRVFAALRVSLADDALPRLPVEVHALVGEITWAQVADMLRISESLPWLAGLKGVSKTAMAHQMLWLLVGGDPPSPRQAKPGQALRLALLRQISEPFEAEADAEAKRAKKGGGKYDYSAARARVACSLPWSAPADLPMLRALMTDATGAAAKLGAALRAVDPPCAPTPRPPTPPSCTRSDSRMPLPLASTCI
jgi:hypothetical protein